MTHSTPDEQQPRVPGVRYRKVPRFRTETTTIDGIPETRQVQYMAWEPKPPVDWDGVLLRGVTGAAVAGTGLTVAGSVASIGGLLSMQMPAEVGYSVALGFDLTWLACTAVEYVERDRPERAKRARAGGWIALAFTMAAIVAYGIVLHHWEVGAVAAAVPAMNKYLLDMVIGAYTADVPEGTAFWMRQQTARGLARAAVARQLRRMDRHQAYMLAAFGPEAVARAAAVTNAVPAQQAVPAAPSALQAPVLPPSGQAEPVSGQPVPPVSGQGKAPVLPVPEAPVPPPSGQGEPESGQTPGQGQAPDPQKPEPSIAQIGGSIAGAIRRLLAEDPKWQDDQHLDDLVKAVEAACGPRDKLAETVRRTRDRQLKKPKRTA